MGEAHEKTKESSEYLKYLTQQAVALQRTMNEIYKNGSNASITPLKVTDEELCESAYQSCCDDVVISERVTRQVVCQANEARSNFVFVLSSSLVFQFTAPSMASVLEQLNIINGIIFIPLRYVERRL